MHDNFDEILPQPEALRGLQRFYASTGHQLDVCADRLKSGRPIAVIGMGSSLYAGRLLAGALRSHGLPCLCMLAEEALGCADVLAGFTTVLISQSGESGELVQLVRLLRDCAERGVVITNNMNGTLARACPQATLPMLAGQELFSATRTFTNTLAIAALLGARVVGRGVSIDTFGAIASGMDRVLAMAMPVMHAAKAGRQTPAAESAMLRVITAGAPAFVVGCDAPGEIIAHQAGLLFKEVARANVEGQSLGTFRHGPQETLAAKPRVAFIARVFDQAVTRYIEQADKHGAATLRIDAELFEQSGIALPADAGDCGFALLSALVVELWVVNTSYRNGYVPGHFLVGGKVTGTIGSE